MCERRYEGTGSHPLRHFEDDGSVVFVFDLGTRSRSTRITTALAETITNPFRTSGQPPPGALKKADRRMSEGRNCGATMARFLTIPAMFNITGARMFAKLDQAFAAHYRHFSVSPLLGQRAPYVYERCLESLQLPGDLAECGVAGGETSGELLRLLERQQTSKILHLFDTFEGLPDLATEEELAVCVGTVLRKGTFAVSDQVVSLRLGTSPLYRIHKGTFAQTFSGFSHPLCFIHGDADLYCSTVQIIELADRCLVRGGAIVFDDSGNPETPGVAMALTRHLDPCKYHIVTAPSGNQCFASKR